MQGLPVIGVHLAFIGGSLDVWFGPKISGKELAADGRR
jgi:hypothetical protein